MLWLPTTYLLVWCYSVLRVKSSSISAEFLHTHSGSSTSSSSSYQSQSIMKELQLSQIFIFSVFVPFLLLLSWNTSVIQAQTYTLKRCYSCRSRGTLGDCRDPFYVTANSTTVQHKSGGVKSIPCASGWCSKTLEDVNTGSTLDVAYGAATQRDCLQRPPSDSQERCAFVKVRHKQVYMCFCRGDLCNSADKLLSNANSVFLLTSMLLLLTNTM